MIGLIGAIDSERVHLGSALTDIRTEVIGGIRFDIGRLDGHDIVLAAAGIGKVYAALTATVLADRFDCSTIVFFGVAGGLDPQLSIGDIVIAERVIQHDAGWIEDARLRPYQAGHVPSLNPTEHFGYSTDSELLRRVAGQLDGLEGARRITYGTILTGDQFLNCAVTRDRLHQELGGHAIEMEGAAVAQVCEAFGIPWLIVRALSDLAGGEAAFDFGRFVDEAAAGAAEVLRRILPIL